MDKKIAIAAVVVVAIVVIAAAAFFLTRGNGGGDDPEPEQIALTVYVQDDSNNYYHKVISGKGETVVGAAQNAFSKNGIEYTVNVETGWVTSIMNKGTTKDAEGNYHFWLLYYWDATASKWVYSDKTITGLDKDVGTVCYYYGSTDATTYKPTSNPSYSPADNRTVDVYLEWGLEHEHKSAKGATSYYAAKNAVNGMGMDYTGNEETGWMTTINGMGTTQDASGNWVYWMLFIWDASDKEWEYSSTTITGIDASVKEVCYLYGSTDPVTYEPINYPKYTPEGTAVTIESPLMIYGNANEDYTIDAADLAIVDDVITGSKTLIEYPFADANADGKVDSADREIVQKLINRESTEVYVYSLDMNGDFVPVKAQYPLRNIVSYASNMTMPVLYANGGQYMAGYFSFSYEVAGASLGGEALGGEARAIGDEAWANFTALDAKLAAEGSGIGALLADFSGRAAITDKYQQDLAEAGIPLIMYGSADAEIELYTVLTLTFLFGEETEAYGLQYVQGGWDVIQDIRKVIATMPADDANTYIALTMWIYICQNGSTFNSSPILAGGVPYYTVNEEFAAKYAGTGSSKMASTEALANYTDVDKLINNRSIDWGLDADATKAEIIDTWDHYSKGVSYLEYFHGFEDKLYYINNLLPAGAKIAYMAHALYPELFSMEYADAVLQKLIDEGCVPFAGQTLDTILCYIDQDVYNNAKA
jgi:hypothetical protein